MDKHNLFEAIQDRQQPEETQMKQNLGSKTVMRNYGRKNRKDEGSVTSQLTLLEIQMIHAFHTPCFKEFIP